MADHADIDTEMYLRDGMPHATVCKVQLKDGRIGIGVFRQDPKAPGSLEGPAADRAALDDALENVAVAGPKDHLLCTTCQINPPNHRVGADQRLCCGCYVRAGHPPADWHEECMRVHATLQPTIMTAVRQHHEHCDFDGDVDLQASLGQKAYE